MSLCNDYTWPVRKASREGSEWQAPYSCSCWLLELKAPWEVLFSFRMLNKRLCGWIIQLGEWWQVRREEILHRAQDPLCFFFLLGCPWNWESQWEKTQRAWEDQLRFIHEVHLSHGQSVKILQPINYSLNVSLLQGNLEMEGPCSFV